MSKTYQTLSAFQKDYQYDLSNKDNDLGEGSYGVVVKAYDHENNKKVALKIGKDLMQEFAAAKDLSHRNIAKYEACYRIADSSIGARDYAIMQLYADGNLSQLLEKVKDGEKQLSEKQLKELVRGILEGLQYLHQNKRIHRDFKPSNILISTLPNGNYRPLIADFGLTKVVGENDYIEGSDVELSDGRGTASYKAPEQIEGENAHYNLDLWAFGVILFEIITGERPFKRGEKGSEQSRMVVLFEQIKSVQIPDRINIIQEPYQSIIRRCLVKDIHDRVRKEDELLDLLDEIPQKLRRANSFIERKEYLASKTIYETILKIRPDNKEAQKGIENLNNILRESIDGGEFVSTLQSLEIDAKAHFNSGEWSLAMSKYAEMLTKDGQNKIAQQGIKSCMVELEKYNTPDELTDDKKEEVPKKVIDEKVLNEELPKVESAKLNNSSVGKTQHDKVKPKVYDSSCIWLGTFVGGPLITGYLLSHNFKVLNDKDKQKATYIYTVATLVVLIVLIIIIPEVSKIPNYIFPLIYTAIASAIYENSQSKQIKDYVSAGGQIYSRWKVFGAGLLGSIITFILFLIVFVISENSSHSYRAETTTTDSVTVDTTMAVDTAASYYETDTVKK